MKPKTWSPMQETIQPDLIARARSGSPEAAGLLYDQHHQSIFRYLFYRTGDSHTAEDLTADVFLKMVQFIQRFEGNPPAFRGWLFQIARNLSIDHLRRNNAHPIHPISEDMHSPEDLPETSAERHLNSENLRKAMTHLTAEQQDVLLMRFVEGMPLAETARTLHKSEDAIKGLQRRALLALQNALNVEEPVDESR
jgi:RNA polymerase sigma-70 factor, ECF subfamily